MSDMLKDISTRPFLAAMLWDRIDSRKGMEMVRSRIEDHRRRKRIVKKLTAYVSGAAVIAAAIIVCHNYDHNNTIYQRGEYAERQLIMHSGRQTVTLMGDDGTEYVLDSVNSKVPIGESGDNIVKEGGRIQIVTVESGNDKTDMDDPVRMITLKVPRGSEYQLVLADGTKVWLSAESSIIFPHKFDSSTREVSMSGEAYFEVVHDPSRRFIVHSGRTDITVLGTVFNLSAYSDSRTITSTLLEGSVKQSFGAGKKETLLRPAQQLTYNKHTGTVSIRTIDPEDYRAYREGKIVFRDVPLGEILNTLGRTFDYDIVIDKSFGGCERYNLTVNKQEDIAIPLAKLKRTGGIAYSIEGNMIKLN